MRGGEEPPDGDESDGGEQSRERRAARRKAYPEERDERLSRSSSICLSGPKCASAPFSAQPRLDAGQSALNARQRPAQCMSRKSIRREKALTKTRSDGNAMSLREITFGRLRKIALPICAK